MSLTDIYEELTGPLTVGKLLHAYRTTNSLSALQMEKKLGLPKGVLSKIESGKTKISLKETVKFAKKLKDDQDFYAEIWLRDEARGAGLDVKKFFRTIE